MVILDLPLSADTRIQLMATKSMIVQFECLCLYCRSNRRASRTLLRLIRIFTSNDIFNPSSI